MRQLIIRRFTVRSLISALALCLLAVTATAVFASDVVDDGRWTRKGYSIDGGWAILADGDRYILELDDDFKTRKAPDLKLFLSSTPLDQLGNDNAIDNAVLVAPLKSHRGAQRYSLPESIDLQTFSTLIIHCEQYSKLWGGATIGIKN